MSLITFAQGVPPELHPSSALKVAGPARLGSILQVEHDALLMRVYQESTTHDWEWFMTVDVYQLSMFFSDWGMVYDGSWHCYTHSMISKLMLWEKQRSELAPLKT